jgi:Raf kinase inhibitor-like YbhB/YbcL family protein
MPSRTIICIATLFAATTVAAVARQHFSQVDIAVHIVNPEQLEPTPSRVEQLHVPDGFSATVFARNLGHPRELAVSDDGTVYATRRDAGDILALRDADGDGRADQVRTAVRRPMLHGIAFAGRKAYFVGVTDVFSADVKADGTFENIARIIDDLPQGGQHADRTIQMGPDKYLYLSVGSTCNTCNETTPESATILRMAPDGQSREIFASGLRNTIGFDWHPTTGQMFGVDNGIDFLGDDDQVEELNAISKGKQYGWPYVYAKSKIYPHGEPPGEITAEEWARLSQEPVLTYTAHSAPMQMAFYAGAQFPAEYDGDAFVAMRGSWNRRPPSGYEVVRIHFRDGQPVQMTPFLTGFLTSSGGHPAFFGRPVGVAVAKDGALLVSDDTNGIVYRVAYQGSTRTTAAGAPQVSRPVATTGTAAPPPAALARERAEGRSPNQLSVDSPAFTSAHAIPLPYSSYGEKFSPALTWTSAPQATKSFAMIMEDPDAKQPKPFVHWLLYNVPATTTRLHESIPGDPRLVEPAGALQGRNSRGQVGYMGPKPPHGDPAHHYHFEMFALDTMLSAEPGLDREALLKAINGHVLASGEVVGTFAAPK